MGRSVSKTKLGRLKHLGSGKPFPVTVVVEYDADEPSEYKWTVHCPALPACFSEGRTREEAITYIREVVAAYFDLLTEDLARKDIEIVGVAS
jgi:predicted RNase H-like HicB family nuclease